MRTISVVGIGAGDPEHITVHWRESVAAAENAAGRVIPFEKAWEGSSVAVWAVVDLGAQKLYSPPLVLCQIEVFNCKLKQPVSSVQRRNAVPAKQPRIACGVESAPKWTGAPPTTLLPDLNKIGTVALTADINTASGGFQAIPCYVARVMGPRFFPDGNGVPTYTDALIDLPTNPAQTPSHFTVRIFPFTAIQTTASVINVGDITRVWQVSWLGVEG